MLKNKRTCFVAPVALAKKKYMPGRCSTLVLHAPTPEKQRFLSFISLGRREIKDALPRSSGFRLLAAVTIVK